MQFPGGYDATFTGCEIKNSGGGDNVLMDTDTCYLNGCKGDGTNGKVKTGGSGTFYINGFDSGATIPIGFAKFTDTKAAGNNDGGSSIAGTQTRVLNTEDYDTLGRFSAPSSNQISFPVGTYLIHATAPAYRVNRHQLSIYDATNTTTLAAGRGNYSNTGVAAGNAAEASCFLTVTSGTVDVEIRHWTEVARGTDGLGLDSNGSGLSNVYTQVHVNVLS